MVCILDPGDIFCQDIPNIYQKLDIKLIQKLWTVEKKGTGKAKGGYFERKYISKTRHIPNILQ